MSRLSIERVREEVASVPRFLVEAQCRTGGVLYVIEANNLECAKQSVLETMEKRRETFATLYDHYALFETAIHEISDTGVTLNMHEVLGKSKLKQEKKR